MRTKFVFVSLTSTAIAGTSYACNQRRHASYMPAIMLIEGMSRDQESLNSQNVRRSQHITQ